MYLIGAHTSIAGGLEMAAVRAKSLGATAFALFTKNQRQWTSPPLGEETCAAFRKRVRELGFSPRAILPHDSYLINLGNPDGEKRKKAVASFTLEMERCRRLGLSKLNFHPGSHLGLVTMEREIALIADSLDTALVQVEGVTAVIETTAGSGTASGSRFEEIRDIIAQSHHPDRLGVCVDTCHIFAAGYDLRTRESWERTFSAFGEVIGFDKLAGMHLNDARKELNSHVDRHAPLGEGMIGREPFVWIMQDARFAGIPLILETPDPSLWSDEIAFLRKSIREK